MSSQTTQSMLKAAQWERAKGELRAFVAIQGSYPSGENSERWRQLEARVDSFIASVEDDALDE